MRRAALLLSGLVALATLAGTGGCAAPRSQHEDADRAPADREPPAAEGADDVAVLAGDRNIAGAPAAREHPTAEATAPGASIRVDAEPYVVDPRGEPDGVPVRGADGVTTPISGASRLVGPVAVYRVLDADLVELEPDERAALAGAIEDRDLLTPSVRGLRNTRDMTERARSEGARSVAIVRFLGEGRDRRARVILLGPDGRGIAVLPDLEPSLAVVAAAIRERLE